ncbi:hypothetical protein BDQ94DRAFT_132861 [Aspergillus welwitschiae]|uniref:Uncharacterized protein n=1 Tax=Aspergillus welwitschiae TaxID=1341132 RepID=A0A3F3QJE6_9EURO|nr:hypothetical protein BDQ94DRAFT_132861 [Aspergillus welwitschiae]RDH39311.1 hypothetical protein BDQ94DRAFT_132861 [Aspergillus welwitschiae]
MLCSHSHCRVVQELMDLTRVSLLPSKNSIQDHGAVLLLEREKRLTFSQLSGWLDRPPVLVRRLHPG